MGGGARLAAAATVRREAARRAAGPAGAAGGPIDLFNLYRLSPNFTDYRTATENIFAFLENIGPLPLAFSNRPAIIGYNLIVWRICQRGEHDMKMTAEEVGKNVLKHLGDLEPMQAKLLLTMIDGAADNGCVAIHQKTGKTDKEMTAKIRATMKKLRDAVEPVLNSRTEVDGSIESLLKVMLENIEKERAEKGDLIDSGKGFSIDLSQLDKFNKFSNN